MYTRGSGRYENSWRGRSLGCCPIQQISRHRSDWGVEGMKRSYIEKQFCWTALSDGENHSITAALISECLLHSQTERQGYCIQLNRRMMLLHIGKWGGRQCYFISLDQGNKLSLMLVGTVSWGHLLHTVSTLL